MAWWCLCESFCLLEPQIEDGVRGGYGIFLVLIPNFIWEHHHLLLLTGLGNLTGAYLAFFLDCLSPTLCPSHHSCEILTKFGWEGGNSLWEINTLFLLLRPRPSLQRLNRQRLLQLKESISSKDNCLCLEFRNSSGKYGSSALVSSLLLYFWDLGQ